MTVAEAKAPAQARRVRARLDGPEDRGRRAVRRRRRRASGDRGAGRARSRRSPAMPGRRGRAGLGRGRPGLRNCWTITYSAKCPDDPRRARERHEEDARRAARRARAARPRAGPSSHPTGPLHATRLKPTARPTEATTMRKRPRRPRPGQEEMWLTVPVSGQDARGVPRSGVETVRGAHLRGPLVPGAPASAWAIGRAAE